MRAFRGLSLPLLNSARGGGFANEAIPWAKAFIGAQELGLHCLHPAWGLNRRGYSRDFGTSRLDSVVHPALRLALPTVRITHEMVRGTGETDYALALRALSRELELPRGRPVVVTHETMHGGWIGVRRARSFLHGELVRPPHVAGDLYRIGNMLDPQKLTIGVHLRFGDFARGDGGPQPGIYNMSLPDPWYEGVVGALLDTFPDRAQALLVTDGPDEPVVRRLLERDGVLLPPRRRLPLLSDLASLASADVLVCSVSAFSQLAAFLSDSPYLWFDRHLNDHGGWRSIWGHEAKEQGPTGLTARNLADAATSEDAVWGRGFGTDDSGRIPTALADLLERRLSLKRRKRDLIYSGVVRST